MVMFSLQFTGLAQEANTFVHTIKQGETVYSIARTYKISPDEIIRLNPSAADGIKAGATLTIPQQDVQKGKERFHTIQPGETLYRLTQNYHVSAEKICNINPGLTVENFKAGMVIRIPPADKTVTLPPVQEPEQPQGVANSGCQEMHKVKRKETLYSISKKYHLSEDEIRKANPEMLQPDYKLKRGTYICIPYPQPRKQETTITIKEEKLPTNEELMGQKTTPAPQKLVRMGVILPFKGGTAENNKMVEFYRGVLMAVERIKQNGTSVDVFAYDSGQSAGDIQNVINNHPISNLDFIIGPLHPEQITPLSKFCQQHHIKLVVPFSSLGECVYQNPYYYAVNPPKSFQLSAASQLTMRLFGNENIVVLNSNENDQDAEDFTEMIRKSLQQNNKKAQTLQINDSDTKWAEVMNAYKKNVIIPNSASIKLLNQLFPKLKAFSQQHPEYTFKLIGYPEWQTYTSNHLENFYRFDTYVYTPFFRNPLNGNTEEFENNYQKSFHEPTLISWQHFGMLGYDTAFYFLKGISSYGPAFEQYQSQTAITPYQNNFKFGRISNWSGFINREMEFIHYTPSHNIELIRLKQ